MQSAGLANAADESIDPSARKERGPQDDREFADPPPLRFPQQIEQPM